MPWMTEAIQKSGIQAKHLIESVMHILPSAEIFICTNDEMEQEIIAEWKFKRKDLLILMQNMEYLKKFMLGKYFSHINAIWIVEGRGELWHVIIHEFLHSIQKCGPHREVITEFLTYKMVNDPMLFDEKLVKEWDNIEKTHGLQKIKARYLANGDCEDF